MLKLSFYSLNSVKHTTPIVNYSNSKKTSVYGFGSPSFRIK